MLGQDFAKNMSSIIDGLEAWAQGNTRFRFTEDSHGELGIICSSFNLMADRLDEAKKKIFNLKKIASGRKFAKKMAHEIKNPLTPIRMILSQVVREYSGKDPKYHKLLVNAESIVGDEVKALTNLVDNFSEFARLPEPKLVETNVVTLAEHAVTMQQLTFPKHSIKSSADLERITAPVDPGLIVQVLINLIKNAAEATESGLNIEVRLETSPQQVTIEVSDDGPGIPENLQARIFEPHFSSKKQNNNGSMGLGLTICQKIILDHDGVISFSSRENLTTFTIVLKRSAMHGT